MKGREICICGRCGYNFDIKEASIRKYELYDIIFKDKCCPKCGCVGFTPERELKYSAKYDYVNDVYH